MFKLDKPINGEDAEYAKVYAARLLPLIKACKRPKTDLVI